MNRKRLLSALALALCCCVPLTGCGTAAAMQATDLMKGVEKSAAAPAGALTDAGKTAVADFAARLFAACADGTENVMISPLSVLEALGMTAGGAQGETRAQMEAAFGLSSEELDAALAGWTAALTGNKKVRLGLANSIWLRDDPDLTVEQDFLQHNADVYGAAAYRSAFDGAAVRDINRWVDEKTDGMIDRLLDEIPDSAMLYLINALAFEAEWEKAYSRENVVAGAFAAADGEKQAKLMHGTEYAYLEDADTTGFVKNYAGGGYAFVGLLPAEDVSLRDWIAGLTGEKLRALLDGEQQIKTYTELPKFRSAYETELSEVLQGMGMTDAFAGDRADFGAMGHYGTGPLFISAVIHKTYIDVSETGTKAAAVTAAEMSTTSAAPEETRTVCLDRPFVYLIVDTGTGLPLFLGCVADPTK